MKLTTKSRYGVRAIFDIAYNAGGLPAQIRDISERQRISPRYLEQIFQHLLDFVKNFLLVFHAFPCRARWDSTSAAKAFILVKCWRVSSESDLRLMPY